MLITTHLGQSTAITPAEEAQLPQYISILQQCKNAEDNLWAAYAAINAVAQTVGGVGSLPTIVFTRYNEAREQLLIAANDWVAVRKKTDPEVLRQAGEDPNKAPVPPPRFVVGANGLGALRAAAVPIQQVQVAYGPVGAERTLPLGGATIQQPQFYAANGGLGNPVMIVLVFLGLGFVVLCIAVAAREWFRPEVEHNRSMATQAEQNSQMVRTEIDSLLKLYTSCVGTSVDPKVRADCLDKAQKGITAVVTATPKPKQPPWRGGWLGTAAVVVVTGAVSVGIYILVRKQREKRRGMRTLPSPPRKKPLTREA